MTEPARTLSPRARWVWMLHSALVWLVLLVLAVIFGGELFSALWLIPLAGLLILPVSVSWLRWRRWRWDIADTGIDIRHGTLTERRTLIPWIRVQHVETARGLTEKALGLATVVIHTAADSHRIPLLAVAEAQALRERIGALARAIDA